MAGVPFWSCMCGLKQFADKNGFNIIMTVGGGLQRTY